MSLTQICTVSDDNVEMMKQTLEQHNMNYTSERFENSCGQVGYRIRVNVNNVLYFREFVVPEYKQAVTTFCNKLKQVFGGKRARNY